MANFIDKMTVVEAATIYNGGKLAGNDYKVTLPAITPATTDVNGLMGTMNVPLLNTLEAMDMTITKIGVDANAVQLCTPGKKDLMINWVQDKVNSSGDVSPVGCKAQVSCLPKSYMPAADIEVGSTSEFDCTYEVYEYKLTIDGVVVLHVNRLTGTLKAWNGKELVNFSSSFDKLL
ncbi:MAG: phage major tail tube protein [Eggerthellaceae bacterium]|nr:phage major tail tube protein [Eggerthellaceae bacterium]